MKTLLILISLSLLTSSALANSAEYSCKTANGDIEFTREVLVIRSASQQTLYSEIESFDSIDGNTWPNDGSVVEFKARWSTQLNPKFHIHKHGPSQKVAGEENECGVGFETQQYTIEAELEREGGRTPVTLTCLDFVGYHGHGCRN